MTLFDREQHFRCKYMLEDIVPLVSDWKNAALAVYYSVCFKLAIRIV